jgi:hypothetical protein
MPSSVESDIRSRVESFVEDLTAMIRASALDLVNEALGEGGSRPGKRAAGRRAAAPAAITSGRRSKGAKRDPRLLAALTDKLGDYIKKNPGQRIEQIGKSLGIPTKDLALPVKKLVGAKKISTKGQKRATTYFAK